MPRNRKRKIYTMSLNLDPPIEAVSVTEGYAESDLHFMNDDRHKIQTALSWLSVHGQIAFSQSTLQVMTL